MADCKRFPTCWLCVADCNDPAHDEFLLTDTETLAEVLACEVGWPSGDCLTNHAYRCRMCAVRDDLLPAIAARIVQARAGEGALREAVRVAADREHAGGCYYRHQQGEVDECNSCAAARIEEAVDAALATADPS